LYFSLSEYELSKIGESSFCEVFFAKGKDCNLQFAIKIMPLDCENEQTGVVPEPVALSKALHECRVQLALNSLIEQRRYCIPSEYTGFNFSRRFDHLFTFDGNINNFRTLILNGPYPVELISLWDNWTNSKRSENTRPGIDFSSKWSVHTF
jgi:hypothetical protein